MNMGMMMKFMKEKNEFVQRHPKFASFFNAVSQNMIEEGTVIEITVTKTDGETVTSNMRVMPEDMVLLQGLQNMQRQYYNKRKLSGRLKIKDGLQKMWKRNGSGR